MKPESAQVIGWPEDLVGFEELGKGRESVFETARFNHSRTSPNQTPLFSHNLHALSLRRLSGWEGHSIFAVVKNPRLLSAPLLGLVTVHARTNSGSMCRS